MKSTHLVWNIFITCKDNFYKHKKWQRSNPWITAFIFATEISVLKRTIFGGRHGTWIAVEWIIDFCHGVILTSCKIFASN